MTRRDATHLASSEGSLVLSSALPSSPSSRCSAFLTRLCSRCSVERALALTMLRAARRRSGLRLSLPVNDGSREGWSRRFRQPHGHRFGERDHRARRATRPHCHRSRPPPTAHGHCATAVRGARPARLRRLSRPLTLRVRTRLGWYGALPKGPFDSSLPPQRETSRPRCRWIRIESMMTRTRSNT